MNSSYDRFESILGVQRHRRDECQLELAQLTSQHESAVTRLDELRSEHQRVLNGVGSGDKGIVRLAELREIERKDIQYRAAEQSLLSQVNSLVQQIVDQRSRLLEAQQEFQKLERLQAGRQAEHRIKANREAQKRFDEQASVTYQRSRG